MQDWTGGSTPANRFPMKLITRGVIASLVMCVLLVWPGRAEEEPAAAPETAATPAEAEPGKVYDPMDIEGMRKVMGAPIVVEGVIVKAGESKTGKVKYLNFTEDFWKGLALVFFTDKSTFPLDSLESYVGKKVRVSGDLSEHQQHLQIVVKDASQIEVLAEAEPAEAGLPAE